MLFRNLASIGVLSAITGVSATILPRTPGDIPLQWGRPGAPTMDGSELDHIWGADELENALAKENRLCPKATIDCDSGNKYQPGALECEGLFESGNFREDKTIPSKPRYIAITAGGKCYMSWSKEIKGSVKQSELLQVAGVIAKKCNGKSGVHRGVSVNGQCVSVCLSNRPNGCR